MTIAMLGLGGIPGTAGFVGKFFLIDAAVGRQLHLAGHRHRARLGGLAGLLPARGRRHVGAPGAARRCRRSPAAPRSCRPRTRRTGRGAAGWEVTAVAVVAAAATVVIGIAPNWLFDLAHDVASSMSQLF